MECTGKAAWKIHLQNSLRTSWNKMECLSAWCGLGWLVVSIVGSPVVQIPQSVCGDRSCCTVHGRWGK